MPTTQHTGQYKPRHIKQNMNSYNYNHTKMQTSDKSDKATLASGFVNKQFAHTCIREDGQVLRILKYNERKDRVYLFT
jgi:hypothetical protein